MPRLYVTIAIMLGYPLNRLLLNSSKVLLLILHPEIAEERF